MQYDRFGEIVETEDEKINDISKSEMISFIESNSDRYINIFKKNENRKFFLHMNWTALFFTIYWMFYRRMFKAGVLFLLCLGIFSTLVLSVTLFSLKDDIMAIREQLMKTTLADSGNTSGEFSAFPELLTENQASLNKMNNDFNRKLYTFILVPFLIFALIFGLSADWFYRDHLLRNIKFSDGGVSKLALFGALGVMLIYNFIMGLVQKFIINMVI